MGSTPDPGEGGADGIKNEPSVTEASNDVSSHEQMSSRKSSIAGPLAVAINKLSTEPAEPALSNTSGTPNPESKDDASATHYGTRSRNRPSSSRPNYAEDVEMEFEQAPQPPQIRKGDGSQSPSSTSQKRNASAGNNGNSPIPGTSTFSANPNVNVPKKRKAAGGNSTQPTQPSSGTRRAAANLSSQSKEGRLSNMYSFERCGGRLKNGKLVADDGTAFCVNDHIYLICEPPEEPYYTGRIMEFILSDTKEVQSLRMNWFYRPRDIGRYSHDTRLVYATMHSDICPLASLRGKCQISHRSEFDDLDAYRKQADHFWFQQAFDRFIHRCFDVIPTSTVINVPENIKRAMDERWKYIVVEPSRAKELTSAVKTCKRCTGFCAGHDSVECAVCRNTYHMNCVRPPLLKKPSRGFAWACGPCSRAQERRLEARRTPVIGSSTPDVEEEEFVEEEDEDMLPTTNAPTPDADDDRPAAEAEVAHAKLWTMRYLGIHCRIEDVLQYDDRAIYPRASSRIGPRHQANTMDWYGRPVELVKPKEIKKKYVKAPGHKKDTKFSKETQALIEADRAEKAKRPKWIQDEPTGYIARGEDHPNKDSQNTARVMFRLPEVGETSDRGLEDEKRPAAEDALEEFMTRAKKWAKRRDVPEYSVDFLDRALYVFQDSNFDVDAAMKQLAKTDPAGKWPSSGDVRKDLRDPRLCLNADEKKRFEEGVALYGSELRLVRLHVKSAIHADIVRYWYFWKKTPKGHEIWGSFSGRRNTKRRKAENEAAAKLLDDIADNVDDSAFDNEKIETQSRKMICKYCTRRHSRIWRRAPGGLSNPNVPNGSNKKENFSSALCERCAKLWRRYAIKWENQEETGKKVAQGGGKAWKKRVDEELLKEWELSARQSDHESVEMDDPPSAAQSGAETSKKRPRPLPSETTAQEPQAKKKQPITPAVISRPPTPPPPPAPVMPKFKDFPCFICNSLEGQKDELLRCRDCRLTVHRRCYGQPTNRDIGPKWSCDMCTNDRKESASVVGSSIDPASYDYNCILCPVHTTPRELVETPKVSHKKKNDRDKERERLEKEFAVQLSEQYRLQQKNRGRPQLPREVLKRTADNNWIHVTCALFVPEIKFSNAKALDAAEGAPFALRNRKTDQCIVCKTNHGAAIQCYAPGCSKKFHVQCALGAGYAYGFDITPVKSSRRDSVNVVAIGSESGLMTAAIWCKEHTSKTRVHDLNETVDNFNTTALQIFAQNFKQADLTLTGTTRKANQLDDYTKLTIAQDHRRGSLGGGSRAHRGKDSSPERANGRVKHCADCDVDSSPRWFKIESPPASPMGRGTNGDVHMTNGTSHESPQGRDSALRGEVPKINGLTNGIHAIESAEQARSILESIERSSERYVCNSCRRKRQKLEPPEIVKMEIDPPPVQSPVIVSPPISRPSQPSWGPLANIPAQAPTHGTWPTANNFNPPAHTSPQPFVANPPPAYPSPLPAAHMNHPSYPPMPPVPAVHPPPPHLNHRHALPGPDVISANGPPPMQQHTGPPPLTNGIGAHHPPPHPHQVVMGSRTPESPYQPARPQQPPPPPPPNHMHPYVHHPNAPPHHVQIPPPMSQGHPHPHSHHHPSIGSTLLPPQPSPVSAARSGHGASNSPNVRNLIDG